jgi:hypothetical protein
MSIAAAQQRLLEAQVELAHLKVQQLAREAGREMRDAMHRVAWEAVPEISDMLGGLAPMQRVLIKSILRRRIDEQLTALAAGDPNL